MYACCWAARLANLAAVADLVWRMDECLSSCNSCCVGAEDKMVDAPTCNALRREATNCRVSKGTGTGGNVRTLCF
jgi:hypothetical protein